MKLKKKRREDGLFVEVKITLDKSCKDDVQGGTQKPVVGWSHLCFSREIAMEKIEQWDTAASHIKRR